MVGPTEKLQKLKGATMRKFNESLTVKLMATIAASIIIISSVIGALSYNFAKMELVNSGKLDLKHIVTATVPTLDLLNKQVKLGQLSLEEAKVMAREKIGGPMIIKGNEKTHDYSKSAFLYKKNGYIFAYDDQGIVQMHPIMPAGQNKYDVKNSAGIYIVREIVKAAHAKNDADHYFVYDWKNPGENQEREKISYILHYAPWGWNIGIGAYTDEFYASLQHIKLLIILLTVGMIVISLSIFYILARKKMKLLSQVSDASLKIAQGELNLPVLQEGQDEIGLLATAFNTMSKELRSVMTKLQETGGKLLESSSDLAAISEETTASSEEVGVAMGEISASTAAQSEDIDKTRESMESLTHSIQSINQESGSIMEITNRSKVATEHGKNIVSQLKQANVATEKASENISIGITSLYGKIQDISNITVAIQHITKQTNLLALNASIEAARAGEHGKGFAVVADEVRKLAEESNAATVKIQQMIEGIEKETESTVLYMSETMISGQQLNDSVSQTEIEFAEIEQAVSQTIAAVENLNKEIVSVTSQNDEIMGFIQNISAISQQNAAASEEVTASIDEQVKAIANVSHSADGLSSLSEELNRIIEKYHFA